MSNTKVLEGLEFTFRPEKLELNAGGYGTPSILKRAAIIISEHYDSETNDDIDVVEFRSEQVAKYVFDSLNLRTQLADARRQIEGLQTLRPVWAQGYTDDSVAAQATASAMAGMWEHLGVTNQTDAMEKLAERDAQLAEERAMADKIAEAYEQLGRQVGSMGYKCDGFGLYEEYLAHKATRQPTQDKGEL